MKMKAPAKDTVASRSTAFPTDCPNDVTSIIMHADRTTRSVPRAGAVTSPIKASFTNIDTPITKNTLKIHLKTAIALHAVTIFFIVSVSPSRTERTDKNE